MKRVAIAWLALLLVAGQTVRAQPESPGIAGVVEVPPLFGSSAPDGTLIPPAGRVIQLRSRPAPDGGVVASITAPEELVTVEYGYEVSGAVVHARDSGWSLVRTSEGVSGWLAPGDAGEFHSLEVLLEDSLAYLTDTWDGFLHTTPGVTERVAVPDDPARRLAGYIEPQRTNVRVVLQPDQDLDDVRKAYRATAMSSRPGPDGTRVLSIETGIVVPVFEQPNTQTPIVTHIETHRAGEVLQTTHQSPPQVLVFDVRPGWFQVALHTAGDWRTAGRVWLQASPIWQFHAATSDAAQKELAERAWGVEDRDVRILGFRTIAGALWVEVELLDESECRSAGPPKIRARGWVPAHAASGTLNIWFYSRGC